METINGTAKTYAYDTTDQLTNDNGSALTYDLNGNRTVAGYTTGANNRMTSDGTWAYTYDAEGNVIKRSKGAAAETWVYGYDLNNRLVTAVDSATDGGAATARVTYVYDAIGNRIERLHWNGSVTVDERFAQDGWDTSKPRAVGNENFDVVLDLNSTNGLVNRRLYGDGQDDLIAKQSSGGVVTWYLTDRLGSVQSLVDNSGISVGTLAYSAFGSTTANVGATDRYQFTGREWDAALGLQFNRDRMYISSSGRWLSEDPSSFSAGDPNLMRYVGNGPTNGRDPSGLDYLFEEDGHAYVATQIRRRVPGFDKTVGYVHIGRVVDGGDGIKRIFPADAPEGGPDVVGIKWTGMVEYRALENKQKGMYRGTLANDGGRKAIQQLAREMSVNSRIGQVDHHQSLGTAMAVAVKESTDRAPVVILDGMTFNLVPSLRSAADRIKENEPGVYEDSEICGKVAGAALILAIGAEVAGVGCHDHD